MKSGVSNRLVDDLVIDLVAQFESIAHLKPNDRKNGKGDLVGWKRLAINTARLLKDCYPDSKTGALNASKRLKGELRKLPKEWLKDKANYHPVQTIVKHFNELISTLFAEIQDEYNEEYRSRVSTRSADGARISVDITPYLNKANHILSMVHGGAMMPQVKWEDVSCALALVTGRRQSEIHYSAEFKAVGDYEIEFTGQLKGKSRTVNGEKLVDHAFTIPTLVKANLCVAGLDWLKIMNRKLDENGTPELVNKRWGKALSQRCREAWEVIPDPVWQQVDPRDKWTYHKTRGLYFVACLHNMQENRSFSSIKRLAPMILGDADIKVIEPYERFDIASKEPVRI